MRKLALVAAAGVLLATGGGGAVAQNDDDPLGRDLSAILADPRLQHAQAGLVVRDATTGEVVFSSASGRRQVPASNLKLLTTAAALEVLGPEHRWRTDLLTDGVRTGSVLRGNLYLRGSGDPTASAQHYAALAQSLRASGIQTVTGALVTDDTAFPPEPYPPGWAWDDEPFAFNAETSALTLSPDAAFSAGTVLVRVTPDAVTVEPPNDHVKVVRVPGSGATSVTREHGTNTITVTGPGPLTRLVTVKSPTGLVASVFRKALADNGIAFAGKVESRKTPASAAVLASHESMPLRELIVPLLKQSNNMLAEVLMRTGKLQDALPGLGVDPAQLFVVDGSGLSRMDSMSADQLSSLLVAARTKPWFPVWRDALPLAGRDGTLSGRMRGTPAEGNVRAKTGSMTGVTALSGYVTDESGRALVFSSVFNNFLPGNLKDIEDKVAIRLAGGKPAEVSVRSTERADVECSWIAAC